MPKFMIERIIPGSGAMTKKSLQKIAQASCAAIVQMGNNIQWVESFVTADKWFCVYIAPDEQAIREHGRIGGFDISAIQEVMALVDPVSAEVDV